MSARQINSCCLFYIAADLTASGCRRRSNAFVIALGDNIRTIDPIGSPSVDAASERVRTLIFNSLVKKNEKFDYVGELASDIKRSDDGLSLHLHTARRREVSRRTCVHFRRREVHARSGLLQQLRKVGEFL